MGQEEYMPESLSVVLTRIEENIIESLQGGSCEFAIAKVKVSDLRRVLTALERARVPFDTLADAMGLPGDSIDVGKKEGEPDW
jgi:hypothetical protein